MIAKKRIILINLILPWWLKWLKSKIKITAKIVNLPSGSLRGMKANVVVYDEGGDWRK